MVFSALIANNKERRNNQKMAHVDMIAKEIKLIIAIINNIFFLSEISGFVVIWFWILIKKII